MGDPYQILGVTPEASFDEVKAAFRRKAKQTHPDHGHDGATFLAVKDAYDEILENLKRRARAARSEESQSGHDHRSQRTASQNARPEEPEAAGQPDRAGQDAHWDNLYRDIDEELSRLRQAAEDYEERSRGLRQRAWAEGRIAVWLRLLWDDVFRFARLLVRGGVKGVALLVAALMGLGTFLAELHLISALVVIGSAIGFLAAAAFRNDKGGLMSAGVLLFGLMTLWLPSVRGALVSYPLATLSIALCLALVFRFARDGGLAGLLTGGVLALYVAGVIAASLDRPVVPPQPSPPVVSRPPNVPPPLPPPSSEQPAIPKRESPVAPAQVPASRPQPPSPQIAILPPVVSAPPPAPKPPPEPRELLATAGAVLRFVDGIPYQLKARAGMRTRIVARSGSIAFYRGGERDGDCVTSMEFAFPPSATPYANAGQLIKACEGDALFQVTDVR